MNGWKNRKMWIHKHSIYENEDLSLFFLANLLFFHIIYSKIKIVHVQGKTSWYQTNMGTIQTILHIQKESEEEYGSLCRRNVVTIVHRIMSCAFVGVGCDIWSGGIFIFLRNFVTLFERKWNDLRVRTLKLINKQKKKQLEVIVHKNWWKNDFLQWKRNFFPYIFQINHFWLWTKS